ncbi:sugar-binding protein [Paenibacillus sp. URB8-2]|uniref:sugar-binding protein n=1 Tax=Paenibacillus sp. URB8-2 TaxID=2741301 RepID=UPI0015BE5AB1|nr:sugar-binding protein [Paenibacillus sp. URB8-2]BCG58252.1 hypothetical protein PUR_16770 [Paenibacillus sp. URB8-2]
MRLMKVSVIALVIVTAIFGSSSAEAASVSFETPGTLIGSFNTDLIHESSGLAASRQNANVLYTHNDSGDIARFFAVNTSGNLLGIYQLDGATATDWEDMAVGPGPVAGVNYVYLGDIGDNSSNRNGTTRPNVAIYRTPEPTVSNPPTPPDPTAVTTQHISSANWEKIILQYPGGPTNSEALMVDPVTGDLFLVMKEHTDGDPALKNRVCKASKASLDAYADTGNVLTMTQVALVTPRLNSVRTVGPTAADISPDGSLILIKNLEEAFIWQRSPGESVESVLAGNEVAPIYVPVAVGQTLSVGNGEAATFAADGSKFYTVTEGGNHFGYFNKSVSSSSDLIITHTDTPPTIDGSWTSVDNWGDAAAYQTNNVINGTVTNDTDLSSNNRILWDSANLYLWLNVTDDAKTYDSGTTTSADDSIEIYIDGDNSKSATYGPDDFRYVFRWNDPAVYEKIHGATTGVAFATSNNASGYKVEVKIPWSTLGVSSPAAGKQLGFEIQINDDDDGGARDGKKAFYGTDDTAWQNPSKFGTAELQ